MIYRFGILLSRPAALEHLSLNERRITGVVAGVCHYKPLPSFFRRVKYVSNSSVYCHLKLSILSRVRLEREKVYVRIFNLRHRSIYNTAVV